MIRRTRCSLATAAVSLALVCTACDEASPNTVRAVVQLRPGGPFEEGARGAVSVEMLESFAAGAGPRAPRALRLFVRLLDLSPRLLPPFHLRRLSHLPLAARVRCLESWEQSRLPPRRQAMHMLKQLVMLHFYSRPEIAARLGYPHPLDRVPRSEDAAA